MFFIHCRRGGWSCAAVADVNCRRLQQYNAHNQRASKTGTDWIADIDADAMGAFAPTHWSLWCDALRCGWFLKTFYEREMTVLAPQRRVQPDCESHFIELKQEVDSKSIYSILFWCSAYKLCLRFTKIMFPVQATLLQYIVHDVFYDMFGFYEFNRLCSHCSVYSVCGQSRGYFSASVWYVFRAFVFWFLTVVLIVLDWIFLACLSVSTHCCVNKDYQKYKIVSLCKRKS